MQPRGRRDVQDQLKGFPAHSGVLPTHQYPHGTGAANSSHGTVARGVSLGGQEELHSGGGSDKKIAFYVYFNFTEC